MIGEENEKHLLFIKIFVVGIMYIIIGVFSLLLIGVSKVNAAETLNTWRNSTQRQHCSNCTSLNFSDISGISTTNYFYTNQSTNVNWTFEHKITLKKSVNNTDVINLQSPTIRLYDGNNGYYDLTANNQCAGVYWRMSSSTVNLEDIKVYEVSFSCDISNFKTSFPSVSLFQIIYDVQQTGHNNDGTIQEVSFRTTETPYTTQNDYTGTINSVGGNIINNQNQNTTTITNNDNRNTQAIIDNQNANSQATIDAIEKQNEKCETYNYNKDSWTVRNAYITRTGDLVSLQNTTYTDYIPVENGKTYTLNVSYSSATGDISYCLYNKQKVKLTCGQYTQATISITPTETGYIRYSINKRQNSMTTDFTGEYCYNLLEKQNETSENIESALTDSSVSDPSSSLNGLNANIGTNSVISDLLLLPVTLYQSVLNNINGTCSAFTLGTIYGHQLKMPCLNISGVIGNAIYGVIDILISGFFILSIRKKFVDIFNHFTSLKVGGNELE